MGTISADTAAAHRALADEIGLDKAAEQLGIKRESLRRIIRMAREDERGRAEPVDNGRNVLLEKIAARYSPEELKRLASGNGINPTSIDIPEINFDGEDFCFTFFTDTHIGEVSFHDYLFDAMLEESEREGVDMYFCAGDIHEGMSNRPDQVYHLTDLGVSAQMDHAERLFKKINKPIKVIDGNHDRWAVKSNGLFMVRDLAARIPNMEFLGCDVGECKINGARFMLWHGEDGSSYATSYRVQKLIESFTGGDKPNVLLCGHTHKQISMFERNIHAVSGGALSYQSAWMRSTKKACHTGFWIIRCKIRDGGIVRFTPTWYPVYK
jgi:predicted phosphodiesterase